MSKKKILLLSDDLRMTSGISTMSKEFVLGTIHKYDWVQLGSGINHPEFGKIVDMNDDVRKRTGVNDANLKIYPYNSYGDIFFLRKLLDAEKPDAILHFTDPHYWQWLYDNEHEIRQKVPILYYHIWDNIPDPIYNRDFYESCDWLGCISKLTYGIVNRVGKLETENTWKKLDDWQVSYVPHGINSEIFKPINEIDENTIKSICEDKNYEFILFFNNRNIRRKQPSDVIYSYKLFCDKLPKDKSKKCLLLMHTTPIDANGTDLYAVKERLCPDYDIKFILSKVEQIVLNQIYNYVDCTINIANNEGFGLTTAESIMSGTPVILNVTGGLQDQCGFYNKKTGNEFSANDYVEIKSLNGEGDFDKSNLGWGEWVIPIFPKARNINGSPITPYIFDDRVDNHEVAEAIYEMYKLGKEERKKRGMKGRDWALKNISSTIMCNKMINGIDTTINNFKQRKKYDLYKII